MRSGTKVLVSLLIATLFLLPSVSVLMNDAATAEVGNESGNNALIAEFEYIPGNPKSWHWDLGDNGINVNLSINGRYSVVTGFEEPWEPDSDGDLAPPGWENNITNHGYNYGIPCFWAQHNRSLYPWFVRSGNYSAVVEWSDDLSNEWLITPMIDMTGWTEDEAVLHFWSFHWGLDDHPNLKDHKYIKVSTDGGETWEIVADLANKANYYDFEEEIDLTGYIDKEILIAFHYYYNPVEGGSHSIWCIDDMWIVGRKGIAAEITTPKEHYLYLFDRMQIPIPLLKEPLILGPITIKVDAWARYNVTSVEFFIDGNRTAIDNEPPFEWKWDERIFGKHTIKIVAHEPYGLIAEDEIEVRICNFDLR